MPSLAEIMSNPELMRSEAARFAALCEEQPVAADDMNQGIANEEQLAEIFRAIAEKRSIDYKTYCAIGKADF